MKIDYNDVGVRYYNIKLDASEMNVIYKILCEARFPYLSQDEVKILDNVYLDLANQRKIELESEGLDTK